MELKGIEERDGGWLYGRRTATARAPNLSIIHAVMEVYFGVFFI
jgi:hypothetical protein